MKTVRRKERGEKGERKGGDEGGGKADVIGRRKEG